MKLIIFIARNKESPDINATKDHIEVTTHMMIPYTEVDGVMQLQWATERLAMTCVVAPYVLHG